jgi:hypothetical protein
MILNASEIMISCKLKLKFSSMISTFRCVSSTVQIVMSKKVLFRLSDLLDRYLYIAFPY